jgi:hypothetical protein
MNVRVEGDWGAPPASVAAVAHLVIATFPTPSPRRFCSNRAPSRIPARRARSRTTASFACALHSVAPSGARQSSNLGTSTCTCSPTRRQTPSAVIRASCGSRSCSPKTGSLYALARVGEQWTVTPPFRNNNAYGAAVDAYRQDRIDTHADQLPRSAHLAEWIAERLIKFEDDTMIEQWRAEMVFIASKLCPIFLADRDAWLTVQYLHSWARDPTSTLADYLASWRAACPKELRGFVDAVRSDVA